MAGLKELRQLKEIHGSRRPNVLFVGNGINRSFHGESWEELIRDAMEKAAIPYDFSEIQDMPAPMQIVLATGDHVEQELTDISLRLRKRQISPAQRAFLEELLDLPISTILTTNYTYELEQATGIVPSAYNYQRCRSATRVLTEREKKLSLFHFSDLTFRDCEKQVWHIHGSVCAPRSVVMGHYYYGKLLREIQEHIPHFLRRYKGTLARGRSFVPASWVDYFMMGDLYVLGFSMDLSEMDLWWLACCKKRHFPDSRIYFYRPAPEIDPHTEKMMTAYGIRVCGGISFDGDYVAYYRRVMEDIRRRCEVGKTLA